jgi:GNAT superfamily N-acetyltransferase
MMITVRFATMEDFEWCASLDDHINNEMLRRKIEASEILLAETSGHLMGYLRFDYFWSSIPYIALIRVREDRRKQGIGRAMLAFLENHAIERGVDIILSSSQANEAEPQAWHRHVGFEECGILNGINEDGVGEIFFRKKLVTR